jgi:hypothetical protein
MPPTSVLYSPGPGTLVAPGSDVLAPKCQILPLPIPATDFNSKATWFGI